jgi:hypothetical protein
MNKSQRCFGFSRISGLSILNPQEDTSQILAKKSTDEFGEFKVSQKPPFKSFSSSAVEDLNHIASEAETWAIVFKKCRLQTILQKRPRKFMTCFQMRHRKKQISRNGTNCTKWILRHGILDSQLLL